jgi:hypothetical protein
MYMCVLGVLVVEEAGVSGDNHRPWTSDIQEIDACNK